MGIFVTDSFSFFTFLLIFVFRSLPLFYSPHLNVSRAGFSVSNMSPVEKKKFDNTKGMLCTIIFIIFHRKIQWSCKNLNFKYSIFIRSPRP